MLPQLFIFSGNVCQCLGQGNVIYGGAHPVLVAAMFPREAITHHALCS